MLVAILRRGQLQSHIQFPSPAERAGLRGGALELTVAGRDFLMGGDIVTRMNGIALTSPDKMTDALKTVSVGSTIKLTVFRLGKYLDFKYTLPERPLLPGDVPGEESALPVIKHSK
ncbi:MAG TPA: PDZ domain-containing protein [Pyrinomonadaceae bacterium]